MLLSGTELFSFLSLWMEMICSLNGIKRSLNQRHLNSVKHTLETSLSVTVRGNNHSSDQTKGPSDPLSPWNQQVHISSSSCRGRKYLKKLSQREMRTLGCGTRTTFLWTGGWFNAGLSQHPNTGLQAGNTLNFLLTWQERRVSVSSTHVG